MRARARRLSVLIAVVALSSLGTTTQPPMYCVEKTSVPRPKPIPNPGPKRIPLPSKDLAEVRVRELARDASHARVITAPEMLHAIKESYASLDRDWSEPGGALTPRYRIDLITHDGGGVTYWLGPNPSQFPCFALCSGWWMAPSDAVGEIDVSRYRGLPDAAYLPLLRDLDLP